LWMLSVDESLSGEPAAQDPALGFPPGQAAARALAICDHALLFVEPKGPWRALKARWERHLQPGAPGAEGGGEFAGEPHPVEAESSAHACFQWALLYLRTKRTPRAIAWMRHAVRLELNNYWYQYVLAYIEDQAGSKEDALSHYSVAAAL